MAILLESGARPYGSKGGIVISMVLHGGLIAAAVYATSQVVLPPREKIEEHAILYVASPPPPPVHIAPEPLPEVKTPPKAKAPSEPKRVQAPRPRAAQPAPVAQPKVPSTPALVAPTRVALSLPAVNLNAAPTIGDVVAPAITDAIKSSGIPSGGSVKSGDDDEIGGRAKGGLGSGSSGRAYEANQVERAVQVRRAAEPRYPDALKSVGVEGIVSMQFIVSADGKVEPGSIKVISTPHKLFADAVRTALLNTRYRAAEAGGQSVRQLVEQNFTFRLEK